MAGPTDGTYHGVKAVNTIDAEEKAEIRFEDEGKRTGSTFPRLAKGTFSRRDTTRSERERAKKTSAAAAAGSGPPAPMPILIATQPTLAQITTLLCLAVADGNDRVVVYWMDKLKDDDMLESAGFTIQDPSGSGLLQVAALKGHLSTSQHLLDRGININAVDRNHGTALQAAIYMGRKEIYDFLLGWDGPDDRTSDKADDGANDRVKVNTKGGYYGCALQVAAYRANEDLVKLLVESKKADVNIYGGKYGSPLQAAVRTGCLAVVQHILPKSNVNYRGGKYGTALQAVGRGRYRTRIRLPELSRGQILSQLAETSPDNLVDRIDNNNNSSSNATDAQYLEVANELFNGGARLDGGSGLLDNPINAAACSGSRDLLELMLKHFDARSPDWKDEKWVVLTKALLSAITQSPENQKSLAILLVENGARINYPISPTLRNLPLEAAATKNLLDVVGYLLEVNKEDGQFADTFAESGIHGTALRAAIATSKPDQEEVAECLIRNIAQRWSREERPPTDTAKREAGGPADEPIIRTTDLSYEWTKWDDKYGNLVQLATFSGLKKTVEMLLKYEAGPNVPDTSQRTALHIAAWSGFPQIVQLLLDNGAAINAKDEWGATPLDQAEEALERDDHDADEQDLQEIIQTLQGRINSVEVEKLRSKFRGPKKIREKNMEAVGQSAPKGAKPVFAMPYWIPGVGFRATLLDIWDSEGHECLWLKKPRIEEILYPPTETEQGSITRDKDGPHNCKVNWIHIPSNNMTWAEMIISRLCDEKRLPAYKSLWGTDPFYNSPDLSPHARFIAPQCGRLVPDGPIPKEAQGKPSPLFMAMPYIHWESHRARKNVSSWIVEVKEEKQKTNFAQRNKSPLWRNERAADGTKTGDSGGNATGQPEMEDPTGTDVEHRILDRPEAEENYLELLRRYLYKRRPVHLRRTLDQYYYSHLADTDARDDDQVVMRQFNEDKKCLKLQADAQYAKLLQQRKEFQGDKKSTKLRVELEEDELQQIEHPEDIKPKSTVWQWLKRKLLARSQRKKLMEVEDKLHKVDQRLYYDDNSPILMIDQLWLWIVDEETIVTCFPHRQYDRNAQDLDAADKSDVLKTIVSYLHSVHRPEINTSHALAELIISQCIGILHQGDMIPELDFLKKYSVQSNKWADQVMQMLSKFVRDFEEFMIWIKEQPAESEESIRWFENIFSVTAQTKLLRNIQDIKDEFEMLKAVFDDQIQVLTAASGHIEQADFPCIHGCHKGLASKNLASRCQHSSKIFVDQSEKHLKHIGRMQAQANQAYDTLKDLLNLKQQQSYVLEARVSRNQAISSGKQSKTIMVFTIVTIIFLPLTFMTTIFTLPIAEFQRVVIPEGADFPPTAFIRGSYIWKFIGMSTLRIVHLCLQALTRYIVTVGITFAIAIPLILTAFEIQYVQNRWKKQSLKMAESWKLKKLKRRGTADDNMPDFLNI